MREKYKGILYIVMSSFCFALMNMFVRLSGDLPSIQKSFFRNFIALLFALILMKKNHVWFSGEKSNWKYLILRASFGTIGILANYYAIDRLVLADASILNKMSPFFVVIFSIFILKEKAKIPQILAVCGAFAGCLFVIKPTFSNAAFEPALIGLLGGMAAGAAYTFVRLLGNRGEKGPFIVFFFSGFSCLVTLPYLLFSYAPMSPKQLGMLLLAGLCAAGGQFAITAAYCFAPAREISIYDYSQIIFSTFLGFLVFGQIPDSLSVLGYGIIIAMAVLMFFYNNRKSVKA